MEKLGDLAARGHDIAHVRIFGLAQRSRHADVHGIEVADHRKVSRGLYFSGCNQRRQRGFGNVADIGISFIDPRDLGIAQIDAGYREPRLGKLDRQRQAHVTQADDPDLRLTCANLLLQHAGGCIRLNLYVAH